MPSVVIPDSTREGPMATLPVGGAISIRQMPDLSAGGHAAIFGEASAGMTPLRR